MNMRVGLGYDIHPFAAPDSPRRLVLGGVELDHVGLDGHSDADAVAHAVSDSLLGPAGLPDLGTLFPASDERYRGVDSMALLREVVAHVVAAGWRVVNVDVVISAEVPRLAPFVATMADNVSAALAPVAADEDPVFVSVRPKRGEGIGAIGRGEGIEVRAVALLARAISIVNRD